MGSILTPSSTRRRAPACAPAASSVSPNKKEISHADRLAAGMAVVRRRSETRYLFLGRAGARLSRGRA
jgi:hypothetical protein